MVYSVALGAFPFRNIKKGTQLPNFCITSFSNGEKLCSNDLKGQIIIFFFWGADLPAKEKRSIKALKAFERYKTYLEDRRIKFISINVQNDPPEKIKEVIQKSKTSFPVYIDNERQAYKALGIFVMPATLIVDKSGKIAAGEGYTRHLAQVVIGEIQVLLGEKTAEEVKRSLHPKIKEKSPQEKMADRYFHMGQVLIKRGLLEDALKELQKALEINPQLYEAHIIKGCVYVKLNKPQKAIEELQKGLSKVESIDGKICLAEAKAQLGQIDEAIQDLREILLRNSRNPELHFTLGKLYEKKGRFDQAAKEYKTAYELLKKEGIIKR